MVKLATSFQLNGRLLQAIIRPLCVPVSASSSHLPTLSSPRSITTAKSSERLIEGFSVSFPGLDEKLFKTNFSRTVKVATGAKRGRPRKVTKTDKATGNSLQVIQPEPDVNDGEKIPSNVMHVANDSNVIKNVSESNPEFHIVTQEGGKAHKREQLNRRGDQTQHLKTDKNARGSQHLRGQRAESHDREKDRPRKHPENTKPDVKGATASAATRIQPQKKREEWQIQKKALQKKFGEDGWNPRKKLSPDTQEGIRALHEQYPEKYTTTALATEFRVSPEAIRRILKSKWLVSAPPEVIDDRRERWAKRHDRIWDAKAELGLRPPRRKKREVESPDSFEDEMRARQILANQ